MLKPLTLSIVIPVYNEESYIGACLEAISRQTEQPDEVLVIDNNSSDQTAAIASRYSFVTIVHESQQGVAYAHRTGMSSANSDIIGRIDADTVLSTTWVEEVKRSMSDASVSAMVGPNGHYDFVLPRTGLWIEDKLLRGALMLGYDFLFGCNMAIRRSLWYQLEPSLCYANDIFEDMDLVQHMKDAGVSPQYNPHMKVMVSARRVGDTPRDFIYYIHGHVRTARRHGRPIVGAYYAEAWFTFFYLLAKPLHTCFDPSTRRPSLKKFMSPAAPRPNPLLPDLD